MMMDKEYLKRVVYSLRLQGVEDMKMGPLTKELLFTLQRDRQFNIGLLLGMLIVLECPQFPKYITHEMTAESICGAMQGMVDFCPETFRAIVLNDATTFSTEMLIKQLYTLGRLEIDIDKEG